LNSKIVQISKYPHIRPQYYSIKKTSDSKLVIFVNKQFSSNSEKIYDSYGYFFCVKSQIIKPRKNFKIENPINLKNIIFNSNFIKIQLKGIYVINMNVYLKSFGIVGIYVNGQCIEKFKSSDNSNDILIHKIFSFNENDSVTIRNCHTNDIITINPDYNPTNNINFTIWKID
jgi:hypothetical protein